MTCENISYIIYITSSFGGSIPLYVHHFKKNKYPVHKKYTILFVVNSVVLEFYDLGILKVYSLLTAFVSDKSYFLFQNKIDAWEQYIN